MKTIQRTTLQCEHDGVYHTPPETQCHPYKLMQTQHGSVSACTKAQCICRQTRLTSGTHIDTHSTAILPIVAQKGSVEGEGPGH